LTHTGFAILNHHTISRSDNFKKNIEENMDNKISDNVQKILACPHCGSSLTVADQGAICDGCQSNYRFSKSGAIDLRLQQTKTYKYNFELGKSLLPESEFDFGLLQKNQNPEVDFSSYNVPFHLSKEIMSYFPKAKADNSLMLDLGCGNMVHQEVCRHAGFEHIGLDYEAKEASLLGDAHCLPFKDESFEFILSIAVLEHIQFPFVVMKEAYRVLKPNGIFIGTVSFLEPFHGNSFYHHTHLGTYNSLKEGGFRIEKICPSYEWSVLVAQAAMGLFPKMPHFISKLIVMPVQILHRIWWKIGRIVSKLSSATEDVRIRKTTGVFTFIARK
jgi:ubiquinone/menaquinone biosynthesis C-methylase UbiE